MKKLPLLIAIACSLVFAGAVFADTPIKIFLNGNPVVNNSAIISEDRTYLPVRAISEMLGLSVKWDGVTRSVYLNDDIVNNDEPVFPDVELWLNQDHTVNRTAVTNTSGGLLAWVVLYNGTEVLQRGAENETQYMYFRDDPGTYTIYVEQFVGDKYRVISNVVSYHIQ